MIESSEMLIRKNGQAKKQREEKINTSFSCRAIGCAAALLDKTLPGITRKQSISFFLFQYYGVMGANKFGTRSDRNSSDNLQDTLHRKFRVHSECRAGSQASLRSLRDIVHDHDGHDKPRWQSWGGGVDRL